MIGRVFPAAALAVIALATAARAEDDSAAREDSMFGDAADPAPAPTASDTAAPGGDREDAMFGEATAGAQTGGGASLSEASAALLSGEEKFLDLGGRLFLRFNGTLRDDTEVGATEVSSPSLVDFYADVRPSDRLRGYAQMRLSYDFTVQPGDTTFTGQPLDSFSINLDQLWIKFDLGRVAYVTAGKQRIRWGTGRFWNPTDFINQNTRNSIDIFDARLGVDLLKIHFPFEALGWNLYLLSTLDDMKQLDQAGVAARGEFLFDNTEIALSSLVKPNQPLRLGADLSTALWIFDLRAETAFTRGSSVKRYEGSLDLDTLTFPTEVDVDNRWFIQAVLGAEASFNYTDQDAFVLGAEYFYNQAGYPDAELYPWLFLNNAYVPLYAGQHYAAFYALAAQPFAFNDTTLTFSTIGNLSDLSFLSRLDVSQSVLTFLTLNVFAGVHYGNPGELKLGIEIDPVPLIPALADGISLKAPLIDAGLALRVAL